MEDRLGMVSVHKDSSKKSMANNVFNSLKSKQSMNAQNNTLWVIAESFYPEDNGTGYQLTSLALELSKIYAIRVITAVPEKLSHEKYNLHEQYRGICIRRIKVDYFDRHRLPFRFVNILIHSFKLMVLLLKNMRRTDKVLVVGNPPTLPYIVLIASKLISVKVILVLYDLYPEALAVVDVLSTNSFTFKALDYAARYLFKKVYKIVVLGRDMQDLLLRKEPYLKSKICLIPSWAESTIIMPKNIKQNIILKKFNLVDKFIFQYSGNLGRTHNIEAILELAKASESVKNLHFLIIGDGAKKKWLDQALYAHPLSNVTTHTFFSNDLRCEVQNAAHIGIISFIPGMSGISVPSRMYNMMAAGKPILAIVDPNSEVAMTLREEKIGWVVPSDKPLNALPVILNIMGNPDMVLDMGNRARKLAEDKYSINNAADKYLEILSS